MGIVKSVLLILFIFMFVFTFGVLVPKITGSLPADAVTVAEYYCTKNDGLDKVEINVYNGKMKYYCSNGLMSDWVEIHMKTITETMGVRN